jgi:hypothetical protein
MYWRKYRTLFYIAQTYGLSEAAVSRTIQSQSPGEKFLLGQSRTVLLPLWKERSVVEHVIGSRKIFRILSERFRTKPGSQKAAGN